MLLVSPEYFKRLKEDAPRVPDIKFKQREHPYDRMVRLRELQDPILRKAQRLREPISLSFVYLNSHLYGINQNQNVHRNP